jgi:transcriptional regulator with XRE-family HTH domain
LALTPTLAEAIAQIRQRRQLSMAGLASLLGVSQASISRYEGGLVTPERHTLLLLSTLAEGMEKLPIHEALGGGPTLADVQALGEASPALPGLRAFASVAREILARGTDVDSYVVDFLRAWSAAQPTASSDEERFASRAREFFRQANPEEIHEVESVFVAPRPGRDERSKPRRRSA